LMLVSTLMFRRPDSLFSMRYNECAMDKLLVETLRNAIRDLHGCDSTWVKSVPVTETFQGQTVWDGTVGVFDLHDHPTAPRCYAWSHAVDDSEKRRCVAVLHLGAVDSPQAAARAAIVQESRDAP
jgi:hypothetical protein